MRHSFSMDIACRLGVDKAIVLQEIYNLMKDNTRNVYHEGKYWAFSNVKNLNKILPCFNERKITRLLLELENVSIIKSHKFSDLNDAKWYTIIDRNILKYL